MKASIAVRGIVIMLGGVIAVVVGVAQGRSGVALAGSTLTAVGAVVVWWVLRQDRRR